VARVLPQEVAVRSHLKIFEGQSKVFAWQTAGKNGLRNKGRLAGIGK